MISISCTSCQTQLNIDDAFAGGVCRCQFCGAIQTVPSRSARARAAAPGGVVSQSAVGSGKAPAKAALSSPASSNAQKTLYVRKGQTAVASGTGLDNLAEAVASSGLSGSGLTGSGLGAGQHRRKPAATSGKAESALSPKLIGAGVIIAVLLALVIWLAVRGPSIPPANSSSTPGNTTAGDTAKPAAPSPNFLGTPLSEASIIYLVDCGDASRATLDYARIGVLKSLGTLRSDQKFQVIFWKTKNALALYPPAGPAEVSPNAIEGCRKVMENVVAYGSSDIKPALDKAIKANPSAIVIATGKLVSDDFAKTVLDARKNNPVKIYCFSLSETGSAAAMQQITQHTGGTYRDIDRAELMSLTR